MTAVRVITWPFQDGLPEIGMGAGPAGARARHARHGDRARRRVCWPEIGRIIELDRRLAATVREAVAAGEVPLVLAGAVHERARDRGGVGAEGLGVVWLDAHADMDTPEDNRSGFFDVMALSALTGTGWTALRETIPGFAPVPEEHVVLAGARDLEPYQRARSAARACTRRSRRSVREAFDAALAALRGRVERVYLHVDLDVLDSRAGRANEYAAPGGPGPSEVLAAIDAVFDAFPVAAAALTAYDPAEDTNGRAREGGAAGYIARSASASRGAEGAGGRGAPRRRAGGVSGRPGRPPAG